MTKHAYYYRHPLGSILCIDVDLEIELTYNDGDLDLSVRAVCLDHKVMKPDGKFDSSAGRYSYEPYDILHSNDAFLAQLGWKIAGQAEEDQAFFDTVVEAEGWTSSVNGYKREPADVD